MLQFALEHWSGLVVGIGIGLVWLIGFALNKRNNQKLSRAQKTVTILMCLFAGILLPITFLYAFSSPDFAEGGEVELKIVMAITGFFATAFSGLLLFVLSRH